MCFLLLDVCGCKYRQCFTGFFQSVSGFTFFLLEKRSFLLFLFLISYCLALSFSESTSRRSRRATQNYWELTTLSPSYSRSAGIGGIFFWFVFVVDTLKELNIKFWVSGGFLSVKGRLFSIRFFVFVFVKSWLQVLTNQCCFVRHSFTTGLSWWNDFHFLFSVDSSNLLRQNIYTFGLLNSSSVSFVLVFFLLFHLKSYILKRFPQ